MDEENGGMPESANGGMPQGDVNKEGQSGMDGQRDWYKELKPEHQQRFEYLMDELIQRRKENAQLKKAAQKADESRLTEKEQWRELAETRAKRIAELEHLESEFELINAAFGESLNVQLEGIPADIRKRLVEPVRAQMNPAEFSKWLAANKEMLTLRPAPNLEAGAGAPSSGKGTGNGLTADEIAIARAMNLSPDQYAKRKAEIEAERSKR